MPRRYNNRRRYQRRKVAPVKRLVTGQNSPTMVEKLAQGAGAVGTLAKAIMPMVHAINTEHKYYDVYNTSTPTFAAPTVIALNDIAQGLTDSTRVGNSILSQGIDLRLQFIGNVANNRNNWRAMLICDKMAAGATPALAAILENTSYFMSPLNKDYSDRYVLIKDKYYHTSDVGTRDITHKVYKNLNFHIRYTSPGSTSYGPNSLFLVLWSQQSVNVGTVNTYSRLHFTDN